MANNTIMTAKNSFGDGMLLDFAPDNTQATCLTHALNATLITMNGNELSLLNDMGNGRVETAYLPEGYVPVGTCEFGGIVYIVSYNPLTNKSLIGCFPSPERNISSDEMGDSNVYLQSSDFSSDNKLTSMNVRKVLVSKNLNPGDKYIIYTDNKSLKNNGNYLSDYGNTDHVHGTFPKIVKLHVVSIEDSGKITYLDDNVRWYSSSSHLDYYISTDSESNSGEVDLDSYRNLLSSGYSVFQSKVSGKLAILAELESITGFETSYNVYKIGTTTESETTSSGASTQITYNTYRVFLNFHWSTDNFDINPQQINLSAGWVNSEGQYRSCDVQSNGQVKISADFDKTITLPTTNSWSITSSYNNNGTEISGYTLDANCSYSDFKSDLTFDKFLSKVKDNINLDSSFTTVTQYFENNLPKIGYYLIDLSTIDYYDNKIAYYAAKDKNYISITEHNLPDIIVNNHFKNSITKLLGDFKIPDTLVINNKTINIDKSLAVYKYNTRPLMCYGELALYECEGYIDFSKINSGILNLTQWRYFVGENIVNILLGLECYEEENMGIKEVVLEFCDHLGVAATYFIQDKLSYSGVFPINVALNQRGVLSNLSIDGDTLYHAGSLDENGTVSLSDDYVPSKANTSEKYSNDAGVIYSNMLYLVRITLKYCTKDVLGNYSTLDKTKYKTFYRWLWTNTLFNSYYLTNKDFNEITPQLNLDVSASYASSLNNKTITYENPSNETGLAAMVLYITGTIGATVNVGLTNTYDTFSLAKGTGNVNMSNINVDMYIGNTYVSSPTNNTYMNVKGTLQEISDLQPTTQSEYNPSFSSTLSSQLGIDTGGYYEIWNKSEYYKNQWKVTNNDFTDSTTLSYYNYNYVEVSNALVKHKQYTLKDCYANKVNFNVNLIDFSKYYSTYQNLTISAKVIQPLVYSKADLLKFQLSSDSDTFLTKSIFDALIDWCKNYSSAVTLSYLKANRTTVYKDLESYSYWLKYQSIDGTPTIDGKTVVQLDAKQILPNSYNVLLYDQSWYTTKGRKYYNYLMAKETSYYSDYVVLYIPRYIYDYPDDVNGDNNVSASSVRCNTTTVTFNNHTNYPFAVYVMEDLAGNKRPINLISRTPYELRSLLIGVLGNLYKVSSTEESTSFGTLLDIVYLNLYTSVYTVDMLFKISIQETEDYKKYILINGYDYSTYLKYLYQNNTISDVTENNINFLIGNILKNIPILIKVNYKEPNTVIPDISNSYILKFAKVNLDLGSKLISGSFNSSTLYIYKDGSLQPWSLYLPNLEVDAFSESSVYMMTSGGETATTLNFTKTYAPALFVYKDSTLYLNDSNPPNDDVRVITRNNGDYQDDDLVLYFVNKAEVLVPSRTILKYE